MIKKLLLFILLFQTTFSMEIVNLKDGRKILVKDDFTWEEFDDSKEETKIIMEKYPELLEEDLKAGVAVEIKSTTENKKNYELTFNIDNNGTSTVIRVEADILLLDDNGSVLDTITTNIYRGDYRLANTYIRVGKSNIGNVKINKTPNWNGKTRIIIKEVENR